MEKELLEKDLELLYINYLKWEKAKRESLERIKKLINNLKEKQDGKICNEL